MDERTDRGVMRSMLSDDVRIRVATCDSADRFVRATVLGCKRALGFTGRRTQTNVTHVSIDKDPRPKQAEFLCMGNVRGPVDGFKICQSIIDLVPVLVVDLERPERPERPDVCEPNRPMNQATTSAAAVRERDSQIVCRIVRCADVLLGARSPDGAQFLSG